MARGYLAAQLRKLQLKPVEQIYYRDVDLQAPSLSDEPVYQEDGQGGVNLYAKLPPTAALGDPTAPTEWVVVGAHYDTVAAGPGADDDASGVAAVLKVAREIASIQERKRGVIFAFFDQEEAGLYGSRAFAQALRAANYDVVAAHAIDMVGWDADQDRAMMVARGENWRPTPLDNLTALYDAASEAANLHAPGWDPVVGKLRYRAFGRSDQESFLNIGVPAALISQEFTDGDTSPHYHKATDTCERLSRRQIEAAAALVTEAVRLQVGGKY
jgi:Zn-dependent M28 family amino/carboxypeptidase